MIYCKNGNIKKKTGGMLCTSFNDYVTDDMKYITTLKACKRVDLGKRFFGKPL